VAEFRASLRVLEPNGPGERHHLFEHALKIVLGDQRRSLLAGCGEMEFATRACHAVWTHVVQRVRARVAIAYGQYFQGVPTAPDITVSLSISTSTM
jgi:hypothetical protein